MAAALYQLEETAAVAVTLKDTWKRPIRPKHVVYIYNKNKESEHQPKLHEDGKSGTKSAIYTVQLGAAV
jgi:hypothetical protein